MCIKKWEWNRVNKKLEKRFYDGSLDWAKHEILNNYDIVAMPMFSEANFVPMLSSNWGSARPDNYCVFTYQNIKYLGNKLNIYTQRENRIGYGYGTSQNPPSEIIRAYTSGMVRSKEFYEIKEGTRIMAQIEMPIDAIGAFTAFWLLLDKKGKPYFEVDIYERMCKILHDYALTFSIHHGTKGVENKKMYSRVQQTGLQGRAKLYDVLFENGWITTSINNIPIFRTQYGYPVGEKMQVIFNDAVRIWKNNAQFMRSLDDCLPWTMEIKDFMVLQKK